MQRFRRLRRIRNLLLARCITHGLILAVLFVGYLGANMASRLMWLSLINDRLVAYKLDRSGLRLTVLRLHYFGMSRRVC